MDSATNAPDDPAAAKGPPRENLSPDRTPLGRSATERLARLTGLEVERLAGRNVIELRKDLEWLVDPTLLMFRKVCGRVVKHDPVSGDDWGVPGATVHVYDTDVNLFGYFPAGWQFGWYRPFGWRREEIATAVTDECGRFCVWIPRFEIDWILHWRRERICFPEIFVKPNLRDILDRLREHVEFPPHIGPDPDPDPLRFLRGGIGSATVLEQAIGADAARRIRADVDQGVGQITQLDTMLDRRAFSTPVAPPTTEHLADLMRSHLDDRQHPSAPTGALHDRSDLAGHVAVDGLWHGPFLRCRDIFVPEFLPVFDVPDITFGVTQDVDGDGTEETIYREGLFDVRWDAGAIPPVTLVADPMAFATPTCGHQPPLGPCAEPGLVVVGHMPLSNPAGAGAFPIIDTTTGYAVRPNRPHTLGRVAQVPTAADLATAPVSGLLELWGCAHHLADGTAADHYRINARVSTDGGSTFGPFAPIIDTWSNWRTVGSPPVLQQRLMTQLPGGWWEVLDPNDHWIPGDQYLLQWHGAPNGLIELELQLGVLGGAGVTPIGAAAPVRIRVDNTAPVPQITSLAWRTPGGALHILPMNCPTIARHHQDIEVVLGVQVSATHLRSVELFGSGCGNGNPSLTTGLEGLQGLVAPTAGYWHRNPSDNSFSRQVVWSVPAALSPGAYGFGLTAWSRAFHPGDGHVYLTTNPDIGYTPAPIWTSAQTTIAIVD